VSEQNRPSDDKSVGNQRVEEPSAIRASRANDGAIILPTPKSKLSLRWYATCVTIAAGLYWVGTWPYALPTFFTSVFIYGPLPVGIWLGLRRRGRPYGIYALCGVLVGVLTLTGVLLEWLLYEPIKLAWSYLIITYVVGPTFLFVAGTLFGDALKHRAWSKHCAEPAKVQSKVENTQDLTVRQTFVLAIVVALIPAIAQMLVPVVEALLNTNP
jgi:hypothetical protein